MQIADLKSTFLKLSRRPFIWSSEVQSWIHWCRPTTDWLLNPPNLQTQLQLQGSKSAFSAFSDEAILPLAATLIPGWRRVNWISELDKPAPITGGSVKDVGKRQTGAWQAVTGTAMQIDFPQIPICHDFSKAYLDKVYFFKVYLSKLYLTGNAMQINFPQIAQFPPLQFFWASFSPKKVVFRFAEPSPDDPCECVWGADVDFSLFPLDRVYWAISVKHLEVWYGRLTNINVCSLGPVVASSEVSHTHCSFKM